MDGNCKLTAEVFLICPQSLCNSSLFQDEVESFKEKYITSTIIDAELKEYR